MDVSSRGNKSQRPQQPPSGQQPHQSNAASSSSSNNNSNDQAAQAAAASLQLLLREDPSLAQFQMTESVSAGSDTIAFPYAATLLTQSTDSSNSSSSSPQQLAKHALQDVERKLALVESLAVKLSRTSPEAVTEHLLQLHGYTTADKVTGSLSATNSTNTSLSSIRERATRLEKQSESLESAARRVETVLKKGLVKMQNSTQQLERVLQISNRLKQIYMLQFEASKLTNYDYYSILEDDEAPSQQTYHHQLRDLTRAAASVAITEDLLQTMDQENSDDHSNIAIVERMRPILLEHGLQVRRVAAHLLELQQQQQQQQQEISNSSTYLQQLGAVLQVYYHLKELPQAVWTFVDNILDQMDSISRQGLFHPQTILQNISDSSSSRSKRNKQAKDSKAVLCQEWSQDMTKLADQVRSLHRVLLRKSDPVARTTYVQVVASAPLPAEYYHAETASNNFSLFALFWARWCDILHDILQGVLEDRKLSRNDVASLYTFVRAAALDMVGYLQDASSIHNLASFSSSSYDTDTTSLWTSSSNGILGGSALLQDHFLDWTTTGTTTLGDDENPQTPADSWTTDRNSKSKSNGNFSQRNLHKHSVVASNTIVLQSSEWKSLQGRSTQKGLYLLEEAFLEACKERLTKPLQYMFPENHDDMVGMDDDGVVAISSGGGGGGGSSGLRLLPSKYDLQRFDENIRQELSLADPREGGGDLTAVSLISECVVSMISEFCVRAKSAMSGNNNNYIHGKDDGWSMTESLLHDRKVVAIMYTLKTYLVNAPEKTFVQPYRPAVLPQHVEASKLCAEALAPAGVAIDNTVKTAVLLPLCRSLNRHVGVILSKIHAGVYVEHLSTSASSENDEEGGPSFVQKELSPFLDAVTEKYLGRFPPIYASVVASNVAAYTIYMFLSTVSMVRPISESARLHITQDLADLEMALEQLFTKAGADSGGGASLTFHHIDSGKPYAELRAVRQLLFWTGLENKDKPANEVAKSLLREVWVKDMRPTTIFQYLFSFGPNLLSSPHHAQSCTAAEYVQSLVHLDHSVHDDAAWMTIMSCCDSYQQRASNTVQGVNDGTDSGAGDPRIAQIVMTLGQELLRRRGRS